MAYDGCDVPPMSHSPTCSSPQHTPPLSCPAELSFPCSPENNEKMKAWLLKRYGALTFNTRHHHPLPCRDGQLIEIHVEPTATPKACHTPASIPLHWQHRVYEDLFRDQALGVIKHVPYGKPVTWCHCMVITRKHDCSPRHTADLLPLNKYCKRETFASESPFHLVCCIPKDTWKMVTDTWKRYHSIRACVRPSSHNFHYTIRALALYQSTPRFPIFRRQI